MPVDSQSEEGQAIRRMIPLATLPFSRFQALCRHLQVEEAEDGQCLFRRGDVCRDLFYLLKGAVSLQVESLKVDFIEAGSESARFSLAHQVPRKVNVVAVGRIRYLRLNADMMKFVQEVPYDENESEMTIDEIAEDDDWMTTLLKSPIFKMLPPANLQKILISLQEISFDAGDVIIQQDEAGDYYYIIKKGQCAISRKAAPNTKEIKLGVLGDLDAFGEDALISGQPRNVTITALTDVSLLRLAKEHFLTLIKKPIIKYVKYGDLPDLQAKGAELIDVREPDEYDENHLPGSINIPFFSLRMQLKALNRQLPVVVICKDGKTSETASFVLLRRRFKAMVLLGGMENIKVIQPPQSVPASFQIDDSVDAGSFFMATNDPQVSSIPFKGVEQEEIAYLHGIIQKLKIQCGRMEIDYKALQDKCRGLVRQVEDLEAELKALKKD